jgi:hypothetical protein
VSRSAVPCHYGIHRSNKTPSRAAQIEQSLASGSSTQTHRWTTNIQQQMNLISLFLGKEEMGKIFDPVISRKQVQNIIFTTT